MTIHRPESAAAQARERRRRQSHLRREALRRHRQSGELAEFGLRRLGQPYAFKVTGGANNLTIDEK